MVEPAWLKLVERWVRNLTDKRIRRGSFSSVAELIHTFLDENNRDPKPFTWTATADQNSAKIQKCRAKCGTLH